MGQNNSPSMLDAPQIVKRIFDAANDSLRVNLGDVNGLSFNLSASGDTIGVQGVSSSTKASITSSNTGVIIPAMSCVGIKSFQLFTNTTSTITGAQAITVEVSPSDTDDVWKATTLTATESTTNATVIMGTVNSAIVGRRVRVSIASAISSGTFDAYLILQGN